MENFDIHILGQGMWVMIHTIALNITDKDKKSFIIMMNILSENFICKTCIPHLKNFMEQHAFKNYEEEGGYFKWTWELHNDVNKRLNKPLITLDDAIKKYKNLVCSNCEKTTSTPYLPILIPIEKKNKFNIINRY